MVYKNVTWTHYKMEVLRGNDFRYHFTDYGRGWIKEKIIILKLSNSWFIFYFRLNCLLRVSLIHISAEMNDHPVSLKVACDQHVKFSSHLRLSRLELPLQITKSPNDAGLAPILFTGRKNFTAWIELAQHPIVRFQSTFLFELNFGSYSSQGSHTDQTDATTD